MQALFDKQVLYSIFTLIANRSKMRRYTLLLMTLMLCTTAYARKSDSTTTGNKMLHGKPVKPPACYIDLSTGICNPSGYFGVDFNIRLGKYITLDAGAGQGTWGNKLYFGGKYYLKQYQRGWALSGGITFSSGVETLNRRLPTINHTIERVALALNPENNAYLAVYHYWNLGRRYNRFFVNIGKSVALHPEHFHQKYGSPITEEAKNQVRIFCPGAFLGGLMVGTGFSFGLHRK